MRAAIYVRPAIDQSGEMQLRQLRAYVERWDWMLAGEYVDTGCSGPRTRPELARLLDDAKRRQFECVVVWTLDRWGRSLVHCLASIQALYDLRIRWIAVNQDLDISMSSRDSSVAMRLIAALQAFGSESKRERIRAGMRIAMRMAKRTGEQVGRPMRVFDRESIRRLRLE